LFINLKLRSKKVFVLVPPHHQPTMELLERAVETLFESFEGHECILLLILQVEGRPELSIYFTEDCVLQKIEGVEGEAEMIAAELAFEDKQIRQTHGQYFCTVIEYLPKARKYARAVTGLLFPDPKKAS
jgi:hypothetical protein